jgi:hypothetical protein
MLMMASVERRPLVRRGLLLMKRPPFVIGHSIDPLPGCILGNRDASLGGGFLEPVRQAIPAEARQIHQVDVLDVASCPEMFDKAAEHRRFELGLSLGVDIRHDPTPHLPSLVADR